MDAELSRARWAALLTAASNGDEATVASVVSEDSLATACKDSSGWTPLMRAASSGHKSIVNLLLTAPTPAPCSSKNKFGKTALHYACAAGHVLIARVLMMYGADPRAKCLAGKTPFDDAMANQHKHVVEELCGKTPGVALPPACEPPVLFKADATSLTICWESVTVDSSRAFGSQLQNASAQALSAAAVSGYSVQLTVAGPATSGKRWTLIAADIPPGTLTYKVRGLTPGCSYMTRIAACNAFGWGPGSEASDVMTTAQAAAPAHAPAAVSSCTSSAQVPASQSGSAGPPNSIMFWGGAAAAASPVRSNNGQRVEDVGRGRAPSRTSTGKSVDDDDEGSQGDGFRAEDRLPPRHRGTDLGPGSASLRRPDKQVVTPVSRPRDTVSPGQRQHGGVDEMREILRTLQFDLEDETGKRRSAEEELARYTASSRALASMTVDGLAELETNLETSLRAVRTAKETKMKDAIGDELSRTQCVVCMSRPKNMLFLPCKHLCACSECAGRIMRPPVPADPAEAMRAARKEPQCPICRVNVQQVLDVYA